MVQQESQETSNEDEVSEWNSRHFFFIVWNT
jgi:hypothetical protein